MKKEIKILLRENLLRIEENKLTPNDKKAIEYVLGDSNDINEDNGREMYSRFLEVLNKAKKGLVSAAAITVMLSSSSALSAEIEKAPDNVKDAIKQVTKQDKQDKSNVGQLTKNYDTDKDVGGREPDSKYSINLGELFDSGSYNVNEKVINVKLQELKSKIKELRLEDFTIKITASESRVPNQEGFGILELAEKRAKVVKVIIEKFLKDNGLTNVDVKTYARRGTEEWDGKNAHAEKYKKDQYVKLDILGTQTCGFTLGTKGGTAKADNDYKSVDEKVEDGGYIRYTTGSIPDRITMTDSNGEIYYDSGYISTEKSQYEDYKYVPLYIAKLTKLSKEHKGNAFKGKEVIKKEFNDFEELKNYLKVKEDSRKDKGNKEKVRIKTSNEVEGGLKMLEGMFDEVGGVFIFYKTDPGIQKTPISHDDKITVYSPVGKTGFKIEGSCD